MTRYSNLLGVDLEVPQKFNPIIIFGYPLGIGFILVLQANGFYRAWPNILVLCQAAFYLPAMLENFFGIINNVVYRDEDMGRELEIRAIEFYKNEEKNPMHRNLLDKRLEQCNTLMKIVMISYFAVMNTPVIGMVINFFYNGTHKLLAPIYLPYTDTNGLGGFLINAVIQLFFIELFFVMSIPLDFQNVLFFYQIRVMFDILIIKFDKLSTLLKERDKNLIKKKWQRSMRIIQEWKFNDPSTSTAVTPSTKWQNVNSENIETMLIELIKEFMKIVDYTKLLLGTRWLPTLAAVILVGLALCLCTLTIFTYSAIIGAGGVMFYLWLIAAPCVIGTLTMIQYENFLDELAEFPWYLLSKVNQKVFLQFINLCQNSGEYDLPSERVKGKLNIILDQFVNHISFHSDSQNGSQICQPRWS